MKKKGIKLTSLLSVIFFIATLSFTYYLINWSYNNSELAIQKELKVSMQSSRTLAKISLNNNINEIKQIAQEVARNKYVIKYSKINSLEKLNEELEIIYENTEDRKSVV